MSLGRRTLFAAVCAVAVASIYAAQPLLAQIGSDLGVPDARLGWVVAAGALTAAWGWRSVYVALAVLLVTLACLVLTTLPPDTRADHTTYRQVLTSLGGLFRERLFISRGLIAFFLFASFGTLWSGLALPLAATPWHLSTAQIGLFGLAGLAGALGATRAGHRADTGFANAVTGGALVLLAASWLAIGQASWSLWLVVIGVVESAFAGRTVQTYVREDLEPELR